MIKILIFFSLLFGCVLGEPLLPSIASKLNKVIFVYPTGIQSERDLFVCPENSACNIIHKRFWLPPIIERICKCPQRHDCNWIWSEKPAGADTMTLDNRSQIKFCQEIELPKCMVKKPALRVAVQSPNKDSIATANIKTRNSSKISRHTEVKNVTALCNCQDPHYWKLKVNSTKYEEGDRIYQSYFCSRLKKCAASEFCGFVRTDTYSTFYRCSCPKGHMCISQDKSMFKVEELLFNGYGYKAFCLPVKNSRT